MHFSTTLCDLRLKLFGVLTLDLQTEPAAEVNFMASVESFGFQWTIYLAKFDDPCYKRLSCIFNPTFP